MLAQGVSSIELILLYSIAAAGSRCNRARPVSLANIFPIFSLSLWLHRVAPQAGLGNGLELLSMARFFSGCCSSGSKQLLLCAVGES